MLQLKRILCPTDLSHESDEALRYAVALSVAYQARLILLHCSKLKSVNQPYEINPSHPAVRQAFENALTVHLGLTPIAKLNWEGLAIENIEDVGEAIAQKAKLLDIDLIVMRSRRRPHASILLGSTAETVSRLAPCPVLVTHPQEREWVGFSTHEIDLNRILVAYDFSADAEVALNYAVLLAQQYQAQLHLLYVLRRSHGYLSAYPSTRFLSTDNVVAASRLQRAVPRQVSLECRVVSSVRVGKAHEQILLYAEENKIDLICVGTNSDRLSFDTLVGSNVDRVLRQAPCPVLITRNAKAYRHQVALVSRN